MDNKRAIPEKNLKTSAEDINITRAVTACLPHF